MSAIPPGSHVTIPEMDGKWQIWSQTDETPGGYFAVPADEAAREQGAKYVAIRVKYPRGADRPVITLLGSVAA